ncbi:hypothetical protein CQW23_12495 [Capsicum baccatum]|uniref:Retrovirus-related Pol polyprotein from transposon TNT 1-94-like beta-barrel domain-containing protein n=1 Tax=Capsicum baccatum TaxID=33114 RepID=A0A2G2WSS2_CAPBA|nr:hypothetical protein CQW23_12495 [Capsicum baccatum]
MTDNKSVISQVQELQVIIHDLPAEGNPREWWMDSGATCHICASKELFSTFAPAQVEEKIYIENSVTAKVEGIRKMYLKMTFDKVLTLNNIFGIITIDYVKSKDNVSDTLTKGLSREGVEKTSKGMGLRPRTSQDDGNST